MLFCHPNEGDEESFIPTLTLPLDGGKLGSGSVRFDQFVLEGLLAQPALPRAFLREQVGELEPGSRGHKRVLGLGEFLGSGLWEVSRPRL